MQKSAEFYVNEYGVDEAKTIPILQAIQADYGYLPIKLMQEVCEKSNIHYNRMYGVATFYSQFNLTPKGKNIIRFCAGTACHVKGAEKLIIAVSEELKIRVNETTSNGLFSLETVACLGCCSLAPVMMINDKVYGKMTIAKVKEILMDYKQHHGQ